jgi:glycine oxidase
VNSWDTIIIGGGIIGLSLAIALRKEGLRVLIVERGEPGREASHAAAGMLAGSGGEIPAGLRVLAKASARLYPEFVHELEDESGLRVDLRDQGTILISRNGAEDFPEAAERISLEQLLALDPELAGVGRGRQALHGSSGAESSAEESGGEFSAAFLSERSVDPRALTAAAIKAAHHRQVDISSGSEVTGLLVPANRVAGVETEKTSYAAPIVVNCAGAWAGCIGPLRFPVRPVKGQMLAVVGGPRLTHVVRAAKVYLVPRSDGRLVIGSTLEEGGYDKRMDVNTIQGFLHAAVEVMPGLARARIHEDWAGLRPGTPDELPILGETHLKGYFVSTGHFRDGILLAPITAQVMTDVIMGKSPAYDLDNFSPARFDI